MADVNAVAEQPAASACCGGPAPKGADACCVQDADAKAAGQSGCGCGVPQTAQKPATAVAASPCCG